MAIRKLSLLHQWAEKQNTLVSVRCASSYFSIESTSKMWLPFDAGAFIRCCCRRHRLKSTLNWHVFATTQHHSLLLLLRMHSNIKSDTIYFFACLLCSRLCCCGYCVALLFSGINRMLHWHLLTNIICKTKLDRAHSFMFDRLLILTHSHSFACLLGRIDECASVFVCFWWKLLYNSRRHSNGTLKVVVNINTPIYTYFAISRI